jgi:hypothetical protein
MPYSFTSAEQTQITTLRNEGNTVGNYSAMYAYIDQVLTARLADGSVLPSDQLSTTHSRNWFRVAAQANAGVGVFSTFIRTYTNRQGELRLGAGFSQPQMQAASNAVAIAVYDSIVACGPGRSPWNVPTVAEIAIYDAVAVGDTLFRPNLPADDTAVTNNAAWSGTISLAMLGAPEQANRLLVAGTSNTAAE